VVAGGWLADVPATYISDYKVQLGKGKPNLIEGFVQLAGESSGGQPVLW
jgi:beta-glucuronidase